MAQSRTSTTSKSSSKPAPQKSSASKPAKPAAKADKVEKTEKKAVSVPVKPAPKAAPVPAKKEPEKAAPKSAFKESKEIKDVSKEHPREHKEKEREAATLHNEPLTMPKIPVSVPAPSEERPAITTTMNKKQLERFRALLEEKRDDIIKKAKQTLDEDMTLDANDLPDEMDLASSEYLQSFTFRLRGREKSFLDKINKALERIDNGTFGICEECGEEISVKRLEARPETTLCIRCKEDQERAEKDYG
jgi:DnaK suppressor protein